MEPFTNNTGKIQTYLRFSTKWRKWFAMWFSIALHYLAGRMHKEKLRVDLGGMCISPDALSMHFSVTDVIASTTSSSVDLLRDQSTTFR